MLALEDRLRWPVRTGNIAANRTLLRSVPAVNIPYPYSSGFGLVGKKLLKLEEVPFVQLLALFLTKPGILPNGLQVFKCNHGSWLQRFYYLFADLMVNIGPETVLLLGNFAKVSFSRFTATGLKFVSQLFITVRNMFDVSTAEELLVGCNGKVIDSPVNSNSFAGKRDISNFFLKNNMQENAVSSQKQIGRSTSPVKILLKIFRNSYWEFLSAVNGQKRNFVPVKPNVIASGIVPDRTEFALWARYLLFFLKPVFGGFKCFGNLHSGGNSKLRREVRTCSLIRLVVQRNTVKVFVLPTCLANVIKSTSICLERWLDFFRMDIQFKLNGAR